MRDESPFVFVVDDDSSIRYALRSLIRSVGLIRLGAGFLKERAPGRT
jgi:FixJ family two-component response regulator